MTRWAVVLLAGLAGCRPDRPRLDAGGATSFAPLVQAWAAEYRRRTGVEVDYVAKGSGAGLALVAAGALDFAVTDTPPTPAELDRAGGRGQVLVLVPLAVGAVAVVYHLPAADRPVVLSGPLLAGLFAGTVRTWDDPAVATLNPGREFPRLAVRPVVRAESSGTTAVLTGYLSRAEPAFAAVGSGRKPRWPAGVVGQEGSDGVAGHVQRTPGAVGYVDGWYARRAGLATARLLADGKPVAADPRDPGYPLTAPGWAVLPGQPHPGAVKFVRWATTAGQSLAGSTDYAPLPPALARLAADRLAALPPEE
jgi:phosphate transport system substrate-binding protein